MIDETGLLSRVASGDQEALAQLYELHATKVYNMALRYLGDPEWARDLTQDVFLRVYEKSIDFRATSKVSTWMYTITFNKCMDELKKEQKNSFSAYFLEVAHDESRDHQDQSEERDFDIADVFDAIEQLNERQKHAFMLVYIDKIPQQEVADILGMKLKALESLVFRARKSLQKILAKRSIR